MDVRLERKVKYGDDIDEVAELTPELWEWAQEECRRNVIDEDGGLRGGRSYFFLRLTVMDESLRSVTTSGNDLLYSDSDAEDRRTADCYTRRPFVLHAVCGRYVRCGWNTAWRYLAEGKSPRCRHSDHSRSKPASG